MASLRTFALLAGVSVVALAPMAASAAPSSSSSYSSSSSGAIDWSGLYAGLHIGYGWGSFSGNNATHVGPNGNDNGAMGGGQIGYNWQLDKIVLGAEGDFSLLDMNSGGAGGKLDENWMSTLRARAGYSIGQWLPYATVGLGLTNADSEAAGGSINNTHTGYALGAGVDYAFGDGLSARAEYLHVDVPEESDNINGTSFNGGSSNDFLRIGANYQFR